MKETKQNQERKPKIDRTLLELSVGILSWGVICQVVGLFLVEDKGAYSIGIWLGVLLAMISAVHMWWGLDRMLDYSQDVAMKRMLKHNILRYILIAVILAFIMVSGVANPLAAFLTLIGLKISAYIQPLTHKLVARFYKEDGSK